MFKGIKRWLFKAAIYAVLFSVFLGVGLLKYPVSGLSDWFQNIIAGFVLWATSDILARVFVRG